MISETASVATCKEQARQLRDELGAKGTPVSHSRALELVAQQQGFNDWNTLFASAVRSLELRLRAGETVHGHFRSQPFTAQVVALKPLGSSRYHLRLKFSEAIDVVTSDRFSGYRKQVSCTIDHTGATREKTSDGQPHLRLA